MEFNELELLRLKCHLYENLPELLAKGAIKLERKFDPIERPELKNYYYVVIDHPEHGRISMYFTTQSDILSVKGKLCSPGLLQKVPFLKFYYRLIDELKVQQ